MGMEGLIQEGSEVIGEDFAGAVMDAALIGAAQRVEHYDTTKLPLTGRCANLPRFWTNRNTLLCWKRLLMKRKKPTNS
jgi:hypothetical protein